MHKKLLTAILGLTAAGWLGCNATKFPDNLPANITQVDAIRNQKGVDAQDKRDQLAALGFDELTINALLQSERLGNQFGGTLRSAYDKVTGNQYDQLTPDEVQLYADATAKATISDTEAQAIVTLFQTNSIKSAADLKTFLDNPGNELPTIIDRTNLTAIFVDFAPNDIIDKLP